MFRRLSTRLSDRFSNALSELNGLRLLIVLVLNVVFTLLLIPPILLELQKGNVLASGITGTCLLLLVLSTYLILKDYKRTPVLISVIAVPLFAFLLAFTNAASFHAMFPQLCLLLAISVWVIRTRLVRTIYTIVYLGLLFLLYYSNYSLGEFIIPMIIIAGYILVFHVATSFLENQEGRLFKSLNELSVLNNTLVIKNERLQTYNRIMSHDLKAPLRSISSFSQLLSKNLTLENESQRQYLAFIERSTIDMQNLINDLLLFHQVESENIEFEKLDLNDICKTVIEKYLNIQVSHKITFDIQALPVIKGNATLLKTIFSNLISNALKYQPKDSIHHVPHVKIWAVEHPKKIEVFVADNGIGVDPAYKKLLFQAFKRFHHNHEYEGTGLGLSICKAAIERHEGSIELHKTSSKGTTFKLNFNKH